MAEPCRHARHRVDADVHFFEDTGLWSLELKLSCEECGEPFRFLGLPAGISFTEPMIGVDGLELRVPVEPQGEPRLEPGPYRVAVPHDGRARA